MPTYEEVLSLAQRLSRDEQIRLREALTTLVQIPVEVEGTDEIIPPEEIAESEVALQDYLAGRDVGVSKEELKRKLFRSKFG
ncbi:hypothetical protein [Iningainema tapete]|uniref:Addiction module component n=1 Tax=Iningainema tapete BLCC-T55 TaxID=2748662 RepID=A0A8J6Y268_9CYAN|nr:hypothetical protein [Iningainema tapete]MBD2778078.1 hypothetical protein [Iningainema tapete BLCC-T55]